MVVAIHIQPWTLTWLETRTIWPLTSQMTPFCFSFPCFTLWFPQLEREEGRVSPGHWVTHILPSTFHNMLEPSYRPTVLSHTARCEESPLITDFAGCKSKQNTPQISAGCATISVYVLNICRKFALEEAEFSKPIRCRYLEYFPELFFSDLILQYNRRRGNILQSSSASLHSGNRTLQDWNEKCVDLSCRERRGESDTENSSPANWLQY